MRTNRKILERWIVEINNRTKGVVLLSMYFENEGLRIDGHTKEGTFALGSNLKPKEAALIITTLHIYTLACNK